MLAIACAGILGSAVPRAYLPHISHSASSLRRRSRHGTLRYQESIVLRVAGFAFDLAEWPRCDGKSNRRQIATCCGHIPGEFVIIGNKHMLRRITVVTSSKS